MTRQKHTAGPWEAIIPEKGAITVKSMSKTKARKLGLAYSENCIPNQLICKVANVLWERHERIANARLIAASPEGLSAAEEAYFVLCKVPRASAFRIASDHTRARLRDYIAAATGRTEEDVQNDFEQRVVQ